MISLPPTQEKIPAGVRVLVAMSGGVDSSVAALLMVEAGLDVVGVTMRLPGEFPDVETAGLAPERADRRCCTEEMAEGARRVAARLGIPHYVLDLRAEFEERVIQPFITAYRRGETPNPCVVCNQRVKLGALVERALAYECEYVATGHYARVVGGVGETGGRHLLLRGLDPGKDQSYVLYRLGQEQLARLALPLGGLTKARVRSIARQRGLIAADRPESQEICFIPGNDYRAFLRERLGDQAFAPGPVLTADGEVIGNHPGLAFYTVGQRRRLDLARPGPWYVLALQPETNSLVVGSDAELMASGLEGEAAHFIPFDWPSEPLAVEAKVRYRSPAAPAVVTPVGGPSCGARVRVEFERPQRAITPGQAVVFYRGETVVGGATITRASVQR